jgi:hypothetical protein
MKLCKKFNYGVQAGLVAHYFEKVNYGNIFYFPIQGLVQYKIYQNNKGSKQIVIEDRLGIHLRKRESRIRFEESSGLVNNLNLCLNNFSKNKNTFRIGLELQKNIYQFYFVPKEPYQVPEEIHTFITRKLFTISYAIGLN